LLPATTTITTSTTTTTITITTTVTFTDIPLPLTLHFKQIASNIFDQESVYRFYKKKNIVIQKLYFFTRLFYGSVKISEVMCAFKETQ
jgi:catabolite regulation protein CreA